MQSQIFLALHHGREYCALIKNRAQGMECCFDAFMHANLPWQPFSCPKLLVGPSPAFEGETLPGICSFQATELLPHRAALSQLPLSAPSD